MSKLRSVPKSFKYAFQGIHEAIRNEPNFQIHVLIGLTALILAYILNFHNTEWLVLLSTIVSVLVMELINTSIEAIVDLVSPEIKDRAKVAKDVAAAAVLLTTILAACVGFVLFVPKMLDLLNKYY